VVFCATIKKIAGIQFRQIKIKLKKNISLYAYKNHCMTKQASLGTVMIMSMMIMLIMFMMASWLAGGRSCPALSLGVVVITTTGAGVLLVRMVCVAAQQMFKK
jgi:hypothetical protein